MSNLTIDRIENEIEILTFHDLSEDEQNTLNTYEGYKDSSFFKYNNEVYDLSDFMRLTGNFDDAMKNYHGYKSETFFSGILVKYNNDNETLTAASYWS